jgi:shikimate kinase
VAINCRKLKKLKRRFQVNNKNTKLENSQNIYLIGMPSSGKSTLGRALAQELDFEYIDMDEILVNNENRSIYQIFQDNGEGYFRKIESELLKTFMPNQKFVISTGGGAPVFFNNMDFIIKNGISIYIDVKPEILFERISHSTKNDRPLIDKTDADKLMENLTNKYNFRYPFYSRANIIISDNFTVGHLKEELKNLKACP